MAGSAVTSFDRRARALLDRGLRALGLPSGHALKYRYWTLTARLGAPVAADGPPRATALITYSAPARMRHADGQIRQLLRCEFVDRIIVSNHSPGVRIEDLVATRHPRVEFRNESTPRGCGHRWSVARQQAGDYFLVLDEDLLLQPAQIARLFRGLVADPERPHGLAGMIKTGDAITYHESRDRDVTFLCECYAVTRAHLDRYQWFADRLQASPELARSVATAADFVVISSAGTREPRIHDVGPVFRCETFSQAGTAVHKSSGFDSDVWRVAAAIAAMTVEGYGRAVR